MSELKQHEIQIINSLIKTLLKECNDHIQLLRAQEPDRVRNANILLHCLGITCSEVIQQVVTEDCQEKVAKNILDVMLSYLELKIPQAVN